MDRYLVKVSGKAWHTGCLKCCICGLELGKEATCYTKEDKIYCKTDYARFVYLSCSLIAVSLQKAVFQKCFVVETMGVRFSTNLATVRSNPALFIVATRSNAMLGRVFHQQLHPFQRLQKNLQLLWWFQQLYLVKYLIIMPY